MKILYLDLSMGAAGDMLASALTELLPDQDGFIARLNALNIPGVKFVKETSVKCGITGTHIRVLVNGEEEESADVAHEHAHDHEHHHDHSHEHDHHHHHHHSHSSMQDIEHIVEQLAVSEKVRSNILSVYSLIAQAESHVHGTSVSQIHFHEVGAMDAIADVTAVCMLMDEIAPDRIVASPVHVGSGQVRCAHGILPVPAPATAYILRDVPIYSGNIKGELCTPTGAALLKHFADAFEQMPVMKVSTIGYGMGNKDFEAANCIRAMLGEVQDKTDIVLELSCNVDDMTAEDISFAMEQLFEAGAREVYTIPIGMKKSRPGTLIRAMCVEKDKDSIIEAFFKHTTTLGVRQTQTRRYTLSRRIVTEQTSFGPVRLKESSGYNVTRKKYEYDDLSRIAAENQLSLNQLRQIITDEKNRGTGKN